MNFRFILVSWFAAMAVLLGVEASASACVTNAACSGNTPTCDLLTFECRACANDVDCGAPLSGDVCQVETGTCVNASTGGSQQCSVDSDCDTLGGFVCSGTACVLGCHFTLFGDTCIFGEQCVIGFGLTIGSCQSTGGSSSGASSSGASSGGASSGASSGGASSGGASSGASSGGASSGASSGGASSGASSGGASSGGASSGASSGGASSGASSGGASSGGASSGASSGGASSGGASSGGASSGGASSGASSGGASSGSDASTGCTSDADCGIASGEVCDIGPNGSACVPGCHDTAAGDTCPPPTTCSVTGGGLGVCLANGDAGAYVCTEDADCGAPGLVCDGGTCVVGCHDTDAGDTCPAGAYCSVMGGGLGVCVSNGTDAGVMACTSDSQCLPGLVCVAGECANGCHATDAGDTCAAGARCNVLDGGIGDCVGGTSPGTTCTTNSDCNGGLVCEGSVCVVGCDVGSTGDSGSVVDSCLVGGTCSAGDGGIGQCLGSDGGVTPACTTDADCPSGLVCDDDVCVVGCHDTSSGADTCASGSVCSATGAGLGVCVTEGSDGGVIACSADSDCPSGDVCDDGVCVTGCHVVGGADTCASSGSTCDAQNGSLGVCSVGSGGSDAAVASDASSDATVGLHGDGGDGGAESPIVEGGGCGCVLAPTQGAPGAGVFLLLLAIALAARKRWAK